jgi:hypothetical protein
MGLSVFREMVDEMLSIQSQLAENYQDNITLRDRINISCDFPDVRSALKLRTPTDSQDVMNRIELFLKSSSGSAREKRSWQTKARAPGKMLRILRF